jgi:hypothetical protein
MERCWEKKNINKKNRPKPNGKMKQRQSKSSQLLHFQRGIDWKIKGQRQKKKLLRKGSLKIKKKLSINKTKKKKKKL